MNEDSMRRRGDWLGASCVPRFGDQGFLFAAARDAGTLRLSGIGGKVEAGETFAQAMAREYGEETGQPLPELAVVRRKRVFGLADRVEDVPDHAAGLIAKRPAAHPRGGILWIAVFVGTTVVEPRPVEKVRLFAVVRPDRILAGGPALTAADLNLIGAPAEVSAAGALRVELADTAAAVLHDPEVLAEWWDDAGNAI